MVELRKANPCDYIRFIISALILLFSMTVTTYSIVMKKTSFFDAVPGWAALILFIADMILLGIVEGLQIALVELKRQHPDSYKNTHKTAYRLGQAAAVGDNVERFLMGRQVSVVVLVFFAAKLTTIHAADADGTFLFPVPQWAQATFFETGLVACLTIVILAQLMPQIVAAKYPVHFMQFFIMKPAYYFCIFLEMTGITHICWVLAALMGKISKMSDDETTKNPLEAADLTEMTIPPESTLEQLHICLDNVSFIGDDGKQTTNNVSEPLKEKVTFDQIVKGQFSRFSKMVEMVNRSVSPETLRVLQHYLDNHPEKFQQFPAVVGNKMYPAPQALAQGFIQDGYTVPKFLTDISDPEHVPPHIVACELLAQNRRLQEEINFLRAKMNVMPAISYVQENTYI